MNKLVLTFGVFLMMSLLACEDDAVDAGGNAPTLEARGIQTDRFSFSITVDESQSNGSVFFQVQDAGDAALSASELASSQFATSFDLNGSTFRTASMPGLQSQTSYVLYAVVVSGGQHSQVARLAITTN